MKLICTSLFCILCYHICVHTAVQLQYIAAVDYVSFLSQVTESTASTNLSVTVSAIIVTFLTLDMNGLSRIHICNSYFLERAGSNVDKVNRNQLKYHVGQKTAPNYFSNNFVKPHSILTNVGVHVL